jgi:hypothetical protein
MRFILRYQGTLKANGKPVDKGRIRAELSAQLGELWRHAPLSDFQKLKEAKSKEGEYSSLRHVGISKFIPLVTAEACGLAELDILLLRPEPPGRLITQGGGIDNRMKTLLDALSVPPHANQLSDHEKASLEPMFCLLEDDNLVSALSIRTEQLLHPDVDASHVELLISVTTRVTRETWGNGFLR